jgi:hypothetical protein
MKKNDEFDELLGEILNPDDLNWEKSKQSQIQKRLKKEIYKKTVAPTRKKTPVWLNIIVKLSAGFFSVWLLFKFAINVASR